MMKPKSKTYFPFIEGGKGGGMDHVSQRKKNRFTIHVS